MDMQADRIEELLGDKRFHFFEGDITINKEWIEYHIRKCDTVLPLVAIATPATYVKDPLRVFELDFEANLPIVRSCVKYGKRAGLPVDLRGLRHVPRRASSTRTRLDLVLGPIDKQRWIYSCAKQLMDRVIWAYGAQQGLRLHAVPPVQLDRRGPGLDLHAEGRQLARGHPVPRPHRARREHPAGGRRRAEARLHLHRRRHRRADEDHRQPRRHRRRQDLQHRQPAEQLLGEGTGADDARARGRVPGIPRGGAPREAGRDHLRHVLRQGLPGRAEPRPQHRQHAAPTSAGRRASACATRCTRIFESYRQHVADARSLVE